MSLADVKEFFAEEIRVAANIQTPALVAALGKVPREAFRDRSGRYHLDTASATLAIDRRIRYRSTDDADRGIFITTSRLRLTPVAT
jgi:hypothetical protein